MTAVLGLGSNLGDRAQCLRRALQSLDALPQTRLMRVSSLYRTAPFGVVDEQPDYLNLVAELDTELSPRALLGACLGIEAALGRKRLGYKSARTIDIDLLLYEGAASCDDELTLPHPRMLERAFVLVPLSELFPSGAALGLDFSSELSKCVGQDIEVSERPFLID